MDSKMTLPSIGDPLSPILVQPVILELRRPVGVPFGLELLLQMDEVHISRHTDCLDYFDCIDKGARFDFKNKGGGICYIIGARSCECRCSLGCGCCSICDCDCGCSLGCECKSEYRDPNVYIRHANSEATVINFYRKIKTSCCGVCPSGGGKIMYVDDATEQRIGQLVYKENCCGSWKFMVQDGGGNTHFNIVKPPCCDIKLCPDNITFELHVVNPDSKERVGKILQRQPCCGEEHLEVTFPMDLDVNVKALLMVAPFHLELMGF